MKHDKTEWLWLNQESPRSLHVWRVILTQDHLPCSVAFAASESSPQRRRGVMIILSPGFHHLPSRNIPVTEGPFFVLPCDQSHLEAFRKKLQRSQFPWWPSHPPWDWVTAASGERSDGVTAGLFPLLASGSWRLAAENKWSHRKWGIHDPDHDPLKPSGSTYKMLIMLASYHPNLRGGESLEMC